MPPVNVAYTLVGFSTELDWRPLSFVRPLPTHRVCDACGLVRKRTFRLLSCRHTLCESCYELSNRCSGCFCPLDGQQYVEKNVNLHEFPDEELMWRQVKCWYEGSNCKAVLPLSRVAQHFQRECRHHSIRCPRCSTTVPCNDVCEHLEWECSSTATPAEAESQKGSSSVNEEVLLKSVRLILEEQAGEMKDFLQRLLISNGASIDLLNDINHEVNRCREALREELRQGISIMEDILRQNGAQVPISDSITEIRNRVHTLEELPRNELAQAANENFDQRSMATGGSEGSMEQVIRSYSEKRHMDKVNPTPPHLKAPIPDFVWEDAKSDQQKARKKGSRDEVTQMSREVTVSGLGGASNSGYATEQMVTESGTGYTCKAALVPFAQNSSACEFVVRGVKALRHITRNEVWALCETELLYLQGYCMSVGFRLYNLGEFLTLRARFCLHKGDYDSSVKWPFRQTIALRIVHPRGREQRTIVERPDHEHTCCQRPRDGRVQEAFLSSNYLLLEELIRDGYVENDQLRVKFELVWGSTLH